MSAMVCCENKHDAKGKAGPFYWCLYLLMDVVIALWEFSELSALSERERERERERVRE